MANFSSENTFICDTRDLESEQVGPALDSLGCGFCPFGGQCRVESYEIALGADGGGKIIMYRYIVGQSCRNAIEQGKPSCRGILQYNTPLLIKEDHRRNPENARQGVVMGIE